MIVIWSFHHFFSVAPIQVEYFWSYVQKSNCYLSEALPQDEQHGQQHSKTIDRGSQHFLYHF